MLRRLFCILPATLTLKFARTDLSHLIIKIYVFGLKMSSEKLRMGNYALLVLHVPNHF
jgi:hypothetical protein